MQAGPLPGLTLQHGAGGAWVRARGRRPSPVDPPETAGHPFFPDFSWRTFEQSSAATTVCGKMVPLLKPGTVVSVHH